MKKTITTLLVAAVSFAGVSCSIQEDAIVQQENAKALNQGDKALEDQSLNSQKFADLKIDFVTLFKYSNENELIVESERIYRLALEDMQDELARHSGAAYMAFTVDVINGVGSATGAYFLNDQKNMALEQMIPNARKEYVTTQNVPVSIVSNNGYKLVQENISAADAKVLSDYLIDKVSKSGKMGSFMLISSADSASLYLRS